MKISQPDSVLSDDGKRLLGFQLDSNHPELIQYVPTYSTDSSGNVTGLVGPVNEPYKVFKHNSMAPKNKSWRFMEALIAAPNWTTVASLAVVVGKTVKHSSGELLICQTAGTCGAAEPAMTSSGVLTDGTATWILLGRQSRVASGVQVPTITASGTPGANSISRNNSTNTNLFTKNTYWCGGLNPIAANASAGRYYRWVDGASTQRATGGYEFYSDAADVFITTSGATNRVLVYVDSLDGAGYRIVEEDITPALYYKISWNGVRKVRLYRVVHTQGASGMFSDTLTTSSSLDTISVGDLPTKQRTRCLVFGDSLVATRVPDVSDPVYWREETYLGAEVGYGIGADYVYNMNNGGSGYTASGAGGTVLSMLNANVLSEVAIDYVIIVAGINDAATATATETANALATWKQVRATYPTAKIIIITALHNRANAVNSAANEAGYLSNFTAWNDPNSLLIRPQYSEGFAWISGTGYVGATNSTGNSDFYISTDSVHNSPSGLVYSVDHIVYAVKRWLAML